jgi:GntR family transcriptional regulator/MocR family aminotransferase
MRSAIDTGVLEAGARVASARVLASELGVARGTVEAAYQRLAGEGYLVARGPAGTIVSPHLPGTARGRRWDSGVASISTSAPKRTAAMLVAQLPPPLQLGVPALDAFPRKIWSRLAARRARTTSPADLGYGAASGEGTLKQAIAAYLHVSRAVTCRPEQVFVTAGYRASLALSVRVLLQQGDAVWIENPCYPPTCSVLDEAAMRALPIPVDEAGLVVSEGQRLAPNARLAIVTPSHQAPLCVSMTASRRLALLEWASRAKAWVFEDDYDGEFHYAGPTLPALKSLDSTGRVLYAGSFSKVLFPALSLGYVVVPDALVPSFAKAQEASGRGGARFMQAIVAEFLTQGHFARHLKRMRVLYARRRTWLADALRAAFGERVHVEQTRGGMHLVVRVRSHVSDRTLARRAQQIGLNCQPLSERYANAGRQHAAHRALLMGFTNVASIGEAQSIARRLRDAFSLD